jgi:hypothetical protein
MHWFGSSTKVSLVTLQSLQDWQSPQSSLDDVSNWPIVKSGFPPNNFTTTKFHFFQLFQENIGMSVQSFVSTIKKESGFGSFVTSYVYFFLIRVVDLYSKLLGNVQTKIPTLLFNKKSYVHFVFPDIGKAKLSEETESVNKIAMFLKINERRMENPKRFCTFELPQCIRSLSLMIILKISEVRKIVFGKDDMRRQFGLIESILKLLVIEDNSNLNFLARTGNVFGLSWVFIEDTLIMGILQCYGKLLLTLSKPQLVIVSPLHDVMDFIVLNNMITSVEKGFKRGVNMFVRPEDFANYWSDNVPVLRNDNLNCFRTNIEVCSNAFEQGICSWNHVDRVNEIVGLRIDRGMVELSEDGREHGTTYCSLKEENEEDFLSDFRDILHLSGGSRAETEFFSRLDKSAHRIDIPCSIEVINHNAFVGWTSLNDVIFEAGSHVREIHGFRGCGSLKRIEIPSSVEKIESNGFYECISLTDIIFAKNSQLRTISGFQGCKSLSRIEFPSSLENIASPGFSKCILLSEIVFPSNIRMKEIAGFQGGTSLSRIEFPSSLEIISSSGFQGCHQLSEIIFPYDS